MILKWEDRPLQLSIKSELDKLLSIDIDISSNVPHIFQFPFLICKYKKGRLWNVKTYINIPYLSQSNTNSAIKLSKKGSR